MDTRNCNVHRFFLLLCTKYTKKVPKIAILKTYENSRLFYKGNYEEKFP